MILIVDDIPANSRPLALLLRSLGYQVKTADSGAAALVMLSREHIALVLLDIMMPEMTGIDVLRLMRADPLLEKLPVVIYSATDIYKEEALQLGAKHFIIKGSAETFSALCDAIQSQVGPRPHA